MKFAGILEAGRVDGILTDSKWVKGTYIVVNTISERNSIPLGVRVVGTKCYVVNGNSTNEAGEYRWNGLEWEYTGPGITFRDLEKDNWHIYGRRKLKPGENAQWVQIDSTYILDAIREKLRAELDVIYAKKAELEKAVNDLSTLTTTVTTVENKVDSLEINMQELIGDEGTIPQLKEQLTFLDKQINSILTKLNTGDFVIPAATTYTVGGLKSADGKGHQIGQETTRYYVKVGQEDNEEKGYAWVDIKPGDTRIDEDSLKAALTSEVINNTIWPDVKQNINNESWGDAKNLWEISGGNANELKSN